MPKISIIVPVYKVEEYLDRCVRSILAQTFTDFELILVDDGSPDNCGKMCDEYAEEDNRIRVIHKENGGLSDARNAGIQSAKAEFIGFVDSDDYIAKDMYALLYENLMEHHADISVCGFYQCYGTQKVPQYEHEEIFVVDGSKGVQLALEARKLSVSAWNKLYRASLFKDTLFPFGKLSEDAFIMLKLLGQAKTVVVSTQTKYYYIRRLDSITISAYRRQDLDVIEAYEKNLKYVKEHFPQYSTWAKYRYLWSYYYVYEKMIKTESLAFQKDYIWLTKWLQTHTGQYLINGHFTIKRKMMMIILLFSPASYRKLVLKRDKKIYERISMHQ